MTSLIVNCPAKVNVSLKVLGKRDDGFHELDTLMIKIRDLYDVLEFTPAEEASLSCEIAPDSGLTPEHYEDLFPVSEENLIFRAIRAFEGVAKIPCKYAVKLIKRIPLCAGLGGGSSDAASTLAALNKLHGDVLSASTLAKYAAHLGSDTAFFLAEGAARCQGRGEIITPSDYKPDFKIILLKPYFGVSTKDAYASVAKATPLPGIGYAPQQARGAVWQNDLERAVFAKYRFLAEMKQWLLDRDDIEAALLCGSGSTVLGVLADSADPEIIKQAAAQQLDPHLWCWSGAV